eukprot:g10139.t1
MCSSLGLRASNIFKVEKTFVWQSQAPQVWIHLMRHPLPRVLTCATLALAVRDFAVHNELRRDGVPDGYDDFFTHLHVTPETHRAILPEHGDAGVTLSVVFALHPVANVLGFSLPPGYVLTDCVGLPSPGCPQVFAPLAVEQKSPFANETKAKLLTEHITSCEVTSGLEATGNEVEPADDVVMLTLSLAPNVQGLSSRATSTDRNDSEVNPMTWWYFHIRVLYPDRTPEPEDGGNATCHRPPRPWAPAPRGTRATDSAGNASETRGMTRRPSHGFASCAMSVKSIREHEGKALLKRWLPEYSKKAFGLDNAGCMDEIFFYHEGGVDVGDVDSKASKLAIPTGCEISEEMIRLELLGEVTAEKQKTLASFIKALFTFYKELHFAYLDPSTENFPRQIVPLDLVAKIDETASFLCAPKWGELDWPSPFGRAAYPEEALIRDLDGKTGASLKLTVLNDKGRVWTMVAGGGASVVYSDTVADTFPAWEQCEAPKKVLQETFTYAKTILSLMCRYKHPDGKFLIIGGGIANFTDVAATFTGLIKALDMFAEQIKAAFALRESAKAQIWLKTQKKSGRSTVSPSSCWRQATQLLISAKASLTGGIRTLCAARCSVHHRNLLGASVFDTACAHGTIQAVEELLRQTGGDGIDMTCALHVAMTHHGGSAELVKRLVDFRADVNDQSFTWWRAGTGLGLLSIQKAIQRKFGKQTLCTKMTYHGGHGGTPLMLAMLSSQYEGAAALVALGVRVEPQNAGGGGRRILLKERRQTPTFGI